MLRYVRYFVGGGVRRNMRRKAADFLRLTADCRGTQQETLRRLLDLNVGSDFARAHHFSEIRTAQDFRQRIPISDYEYFRPYIERVKAGEQSALLGPRNPLLMFTLTSGTTSASKFIPITQQFLDDYRRGWQVWAIKSYDAHPQLHKQNIVQLISDYDQFRTAGGHPCGNISGLVTSMQNALVKTMYCVPEAVTKIKNPEAKYYTALRLSVADRHVGMITTANPSTLIHLARMGDRFKEQIIRDIADGTLSTQFEIPAEVRTKLKRRIGGKNPTRARELEGFVARRGHLYPVDYWQNAGLLAIWTGGSAGAYLHGLTSLFGDVPIRDHGLSASEGRMTIPFADNSSGGILDIGAHYFEFIPEQEYDSKQPTILEAHELEADRNYYILLTTSSGLCRYNIRDVVRCTGFHESAPVLEFLNKGSHISSLTGEKITESQVVTAVRETVQSLQVELSFYTVAPVWGDPPGYRMLVEERELASHTTAGDLAATVDVRLQALNCEYGEKRQTGRLAPLTIQLLPPGSWQRFTQARQSQLGGSIEQYKHPCLSPDLKFVENMELKFANRRQAESAA